jgi:hypothetical protein
MDQGFLGEVGIIMNFNDHTVTWDTDTIQMKDRSSLSFTKVLIEVYLSANQPVKHNHPEINILKLPKFLTLSINHQAKMGVTFQPGVMKQILDRCRRFMFVFDNFEPACDVFLDLSL